METKESCIHTTVEAVSREDKLTNHSLDHIRIVSRSLMKHMDRQNTLPHAGMQRREHGFKIASVILNETGRIGIALPDFFTRSGRPRAHDLGQGLNA